ncbi:MAG: NYN domain-containing protein, partial [Streptosporangiales bacterium]
RLAELEAEAGAGRRSARKERAQDTARLAVLVDALVSAAQGVRRELALPTVGDRPADAVAGRYGLEPGEPVPAMSQEGGPEVIDRLLGVPYAHLIVDGYNVTKTGWPELTLETQRSRLLAGLARLAAQGLGEVTCVFDGSDVRGRVPAATARGVRVLFSRPGVTADDLIAELVAAEPPGRRLVVVSSDREVADRARHAGAYPVPSMALVHRITSG